MNAYERASTQSPRQACPPDEPARTARRRGAPLRRAGGGAGLVVSRHQTPVGAAAADAFTLGCLRPLVGTASDRITLPRHPRFDVALEFRLRQRLLARCPHWPHSRCIAG